MHCGSKIAVREAIRAVQIDNTHLVETWMKMGDLAADAGNLSEAYSYYTKIIEAQPSNHWAFYKKGKTAGWQSTLSNIRLMEAVIGFAQAIELAPESEKEKIRAASAEEIINLAQAIISLRVDRFVKWPDEDEATGFLGDLDARYATGNIGQLDLIAALEWVRDNIANFGGDPNNVTVFGQSGGGSKVSTLFGMPAAKGLFHRGIAMSGTQVRSITREQATATATRVFGALGIGKDRAHELQTVPMRRLRELLGGAGGQGFNWGPVVDGRTLPAHPFDPAASPHGADVPLLIGSTETEVTWNESQIYDPLTDAELREDVAKALRCDDAGAARVIAAYRKGRPKAGNLDLYLVIATDASNFRTGTDTQADRKAAQRRAPVYKYYFQWYSPVRGGALRAMHTMDIPFVFENYEMAAVEVGTGPELKPLGDRMAGAWVAFAASGNPSHALIPRWPAYDTKTRATMIIDNDWSVVNDPYGEEKAVLAAVTARTARATR
jgi:para-nitrobenzyl esterase